MRSADYSAAVRKAGRFRTCAAGAAVLLPLIVESCEGATDIGDSADSLWVVEALEIATQDTCRAAGSSLFPRSCYAWTRLVSAVPQQRGGALPRRSAP